MNEDVTIGIPSELLDNFSRLRRILPLEYRNDANTHQILLMYLKLGGVRMARHYVKLTKNRQKELDRLQSGMKSDATDDGYESMKASQSDDDFSAEDDSDLSDDGHTESEELGEIDPEADDEDNPLSDRFE